MTILLKLAAVMFVGLELLSELIDMRQRMIDVL